MPKETLTGEAHELSQDDMDVEEIEQDQYLVFTAMGQEFGIQAMRVKEISAMIDITKVPKAPSYIEGILNLRGRLVSIINFRNKFGFEPKKQDEDTRIVIVEHRGERPAEFFSLDGRPHLRAVRVETTDVSAYQALLAEVAS